MGRILRTARKVARIHPVIKAVDNRLTGGPKKKAVPDTPRKKKARRARRY